MTQKIVSGILILMLSCTHVSKIDNTNLEIKSKIGESGTHYSLFYKNNCLLSFETLRPQITDTNILLCIPAAFTRLDNNAIDGCYIIKGQLRNKDSINYTLGGGLKIINGECTIFPTNKGQLINDSLLYSITSNQGSFFQQIQMIIDGQPEKFNETKVFQRRGLAIFKNGKTAIVESLENISLETFANDLAKMDVKDLLYTDMGAWDEGWYRTPANQIKTIGNYLSQTNRQSNWIIYKKMVD